MKKHIRNILVIIVLTIFVSVSSRTQAQSLPQSDAPDNLFTPANLITAFSDENEPAIMRHQFVNVNVAQIKNAQQLKLNLFEDVILFATQVSVDIGYADSVIWNGTLDGIENSNVTLVVLDNVLIGNIHINDELYQVNYVGNDVHVVTEVNTLAYPSEYEGTLLYDGSPPPDINENSTDASSDDGSIIDVMVIYTDDARQAAGGTSAMVATINAAVSEANQGYNNSNVNFNLRLVHTAEVSYSETSNHITDLNRLTYHDGYIDNVHTLRDTYKADVVTLVVNSMNYWAGVAWMGPSETRAFSVVKRAYLTGNYVFAHEIGHNMGSHHDRANAEGTGAYSYSYGYQAPNRAFRTIMAYNCSGGCPRINYWSNPNLYYGGQPIGKPEGDPYSADNHRSLNNNAYTVANFRVNPPPVDYHIKTFGYNPSAGGWRNEKHPRMVADVNGDGKDDIVGFGSAGVHVSLSSNGDFASNSIWVNSYGYNAGGWRVDMHPRMMADVNGDGKDDVVGFGGAGVSVSLSTGTSFTSRKTWVTDFGYSDDAGGWRVEKHPRMMADVNGDGKADVVGFGTSGVRVALSTGSSFSSPQVWNGSYGYDAGGWRVEKHPRMMADVNGDGKSDVVGFGSAGVSVSLSTGSSFTSRQLWVSDFGYNDDAGGWRVEKHPRMMADVNGDGKADVVGFGTSGVRVALSTGSSFSSPQVWNGSYGYDTGGWRVEKHPRMMADVNGDGKADVVSFGTAGVSISLSTGSNFTLRQTMIKYYGYSAYDWRVDLHTRTTGDVDGDGKADIVGFGNLGAMANVRLFPQPANDDFDNAINITNSKRINLDTQDATKNQDDPSVSDCNMNAGKATVWYKYTSTTNSALSLNTQGSDYDTFIAVWTGTRRNLSLVACNDDVNGTRQSSLAFRVQAGKTYYIEVGEWNGFYGSSAMSIKPLETSTAQVFRRDFARGPVQP